MFDIYNVETEVFEDVLTMEADTGDVSYLLVYNDDVNTFEWVIKCLNDILGHPEEQGEQLAMIIHFKGKATVYTAHRDVLVPFAEALLDRGLSAKIED